jgi:TonB family protein
MIRSALLIYIALLLSGCASKPSLDDLPEEGVSFEEFKKLIGDNAGLQRIEDSDPAVNETPQPEGSAEIPDTTLGEAIPQPDGNAPYKLVVQFAPEYPADAFLNGIEGYVILEFTVTRLGKVKDIKVIESGPEGVFDDAAVAAAYRSHYSPRYIKGKPVDTIGVRNKIVFKIEDDPSPNPFPDHSL